MAIDPNVPDLNRDSLAARMGFVPTARGIRRPQAWNPSAVFGAGEDDGSEAPIAPAPPISAQARDRWYSDAPQAPSAAPAPQAPSAAEAQPTPPKVWSSAPTEAPAPAPAPASAPRANPQTAPQPAPSSWEPIEPSRTSAPIRSTVDVSGAADIGGDWQRGLGMIGQIATRTGHDQEGAQVAQAIARTEAGLFGAVGDVSGGGSYGPYQFYWKGQLQSYARDLGMSLQQAAQYARDHPEHAAEWALKGYLGQAIKKGQQLGLHGAQLATYAQQHGQVSVSPERAGQWYDTLFGGSQTAASYAAPESASSSAGLGVSRAGGAAEASPAPPGGAGAPPAQSPQNNQPIRATTWFTYADHGKEILLLEDDQGQTQYVEVGQTDKSDGTVIDHGTLDASGQPVGSGQDVGVGDDWAHDPEQSPEVTDPGPPQGAFVPRDLQSLPEFSEPQAMPAAPEPPPAAPKLTPLDVSNAYRITGKDEPAGVKQAADEQYVAQLPDTVAAREARTTPPPTELPVTNLWGQETKVPNLDRPVDNPVERYSEIKQAGAKMILPTQVDEIPGVTGALTEAIDPTNWALGGTDLAHKVAEGIFNNSPKAAKVAATLWPQALMSAAVVQRGVERAAPKVPGMVADAVRAVPDAAGAVAGAAREAPGAIREAGKAFAEDQGKHLASVARASQPAQSTTAFAVRLGGGAATGGLEAALQTSPDDPNRSMKIAAASVAGGLGFIAGPTLLAPVGHYLNSYLAPAKNLPELVQTAVADYSNARNGAMMRAYTYALEANRALGKAGDAGGWNHLSAASRYEADHQLLADPNLPQPVQDFLSKTEQMVEATRQMGTEHGYIGGDVREKFGVARYFPRVYEEHLKDATQQARRSGFGAQDFFSQEREIPHLSDPEAQALKPLDSFSEPMSWYLLHAWDSEAKYNFVESLKTLKQAGVDMIENTKQAPKDWVWGGTFSPKFQAYSFHPDMALVLENMHPTKALRRDPLLHAAAQTWATLKDAMLSTSGFHFATEMNQIVAALPLERQPLEVGKILSRTLYHSLIPGAQRNWELKNLDLMIDAASDGLMLHGGHMAAEAMPTIAGDSGLLSGPAGFAARAVGSGVPMGIAQYQRETSQGTDPQKAAFDAALWGGGAAAFGVTGGVLLRNMLWNKGVPTAKILTYSLLRQKYGGKVAAEFANEVFGGQNLGAIARSKTVQSALRAMTFAADWQEGWVRQIGNTFKGGPLGNLNREYWARASILGAFVLEGLNVALNGHSSADNADGNQFRLKMTGLYDHLGIPHKDDRGRNYDPYMDILGPYRSFLELGQWAAQQGGAPVPKSPTDLARYIDSRLGPVPSLLIAGIQNKDWKGDPITASNDPALVAAGKFAAHAFGNYAPVGPSDIAQGGGKEPIGLAAFSALSGRRITHVTPAAAMFKQTDEIFRKVGISQDQYRRDQEMYGNLIAQAAANRKKIMDDPKLTMQERLKAIGKERIPSRPEWTSAELLDKVPNEIDRTGYAKQLAQHVPGVQGSTAPADPDPGIDVASLADRYWSAAKPAANDAARANLLRQQELAKMAIETGQDQMALRDAIYWRARHQDGTPLPAASVPSEEIDNWVNQWHDSSANVDSTDALAVSEAKWSVLSQIASTSGLPEETVWSRIKTRMTSPDGTLSANDAAIENAFDALTTANPKRFPKYVGPDGKPLPGDPAQMDKQLAEATTREKKADPQIHALQQAQEAGVAARKQYLMLQSPMKTDYERVFGIGRNMTDKEWEQYTGNPSGHYSDKPTAKEAQHRDTVITMYRAATPLQRRSVNVQITVGGQVKSVPLALAYREYEALFDRKWREKTADLPAAEDATPAAGQ